MASIQDVRVLVDNLRSLGATPPSALATSLDIWDAATTVDPTDVLGEALAAGTLTPKNVAKLITQAADSFNTRTTAADITNALGHALGANIVQQMRDGDLGVQIMDSVRPAFDNAAAAIASAPFSPDDSANPAKIISMGDAATQAWRAMPTHRETLEKIFSAVVTPLVNAFDVLTPRVYAKQVEPYMAFVIADGGNLATAVDLYFAQSTGGGRWHRMTTAGLTLTLNSPRQADALLQQHADSRQTEAQRHAKLEAEATEAMRKRLATTGR